MISTARDAHEDRPVTLNGHWLRAHAFVLCVLAVLALTEDTHAGAPLVRDRALRWGVWIVGGILAVRILLARLRLARGTVSYRGAIRSWRVPVEQIASVRRTDPGWTRPGSVSLEFTTASGRVLRAPMAGFLSVSRREQAIQRFEAQTGLTVGDEV